MVLLLVKKNLSFFMVKVFVGLLACRRGSSTFLVLCQIYCCMIEHKLHKLARIATFEYKIEKSGS